LFGPGAGKNARMRTRILSFGFKYGVPVDADVMLDVRFIDNPFFVPELKELSGLDPAVSGYVLARPDAQSFIERALALLEFSLPRYEAEGKSYLTLAIGCTGGRHRSVVIAESLGAALSERLGLHIDVSHRDIGEAEREAAALEKERDASPGSTQL
jgi:RNase adapter protein RapZ